MYCPNLRRYSLTLWCSCNPGLGGGWTNPFKKYESNWESSPKNGVKKKIFENHHLVDLRLKQNIMAYLAGGSQSPSQLRMTLLLYLYHPWSVETSWAPHSGGQVGEKALVIKVVGLTNHNLVRFGRLFFFTKLQLLTLEFLCKWWLWPFHFLKMVIMHEDLWSMGFCLSQAEIHFPAQHILEFFSSKGRKKTMDWTKNRSSSTRSSLKMWLMDRNICKTEDGQKFSGMEIGQASWMEMSIKWHVWWVSTTGVQETNPSWTNSCCMFPCFWKETLFMFIARFRYKKTIPMPCWCIACSFSRTHLTKNLHLLKRI